MSVQNPSNERVKEILSSFRTIAVVGLSPKEERDSNRVARYMMAHGYTIIPVNPGQAEILGEKSYPSLKDIPNKVDIVDVFRKSEAVPDIAKEAVSIGAPVLWLQEEVRHDDSAVMANEAGLEVLQDVCIKRKHEELFTD